MISVEREGADKPARVVEWILRYLCDLRAASDPPP
jgi:hypothetical protein